MTDKSIQSILRRINNGPADSIIVKSIGENVWWGYVWGLTPRGYSINGIEEVGYEFFFIKAENGQFAAAVLRMSAGDLHWYVSKAYRGRRLLLEPLQKIILPFIFHHHQEEMQTATADVSRRWAAQSIKLAIKAGFKKIRDSTNGEVYQISRHDVQAYKPIPKASGDLVELNGMKNRARLIARSLRMLTDVLEVKYSEHINKEKVDGILDAVSAIRNDLPDAIEDARWSCGATENL